MQIWLVVTTRRMEMATKKATPKHMMPNMPPKDMGMMDKPMPPKKMPMKGKKK
jgi:hypothetical protein